MITTQNYIYSDHLYHHGIKGMKWGVRRFQKKDGSLTSAGKKRYSDEPKRNLIQKRKDKLTQQYMDKGYGQQAAETAAKQRMKTELIVGSIAAVSVAVIATKAATRLGQDDCDKTFKSGDVIQNIGGYKDATFKDQPFFAAVNRSDKKAYGMMYPNEKRGMLRVQAKVPGGYEYDGIYNNQIKLVTDVKRASVSNARKIFYDRMDKDPDFKKQVVDTIQKTAYGKGYDPDKLIKTNPKKFYDRFNQALATPQFQDAGIHKKFYSELEKKGYNAILDINDTRYSGYKTISKAPTIFFGSDNFEKIANKKLSETEIDKNVTKYALGLVAKNQGKKIAAMTAVGVTTTAVSDRKKIEQYLDEHPNSKLSREKILKIMNKRE